MNNPRLFLTTMLNESAENLGYLHELVDPILPFIDGIIAVVHGENYDKLAPCASYLESVKKAGKIIYRPWVKRHDVSMNETLYADCLRIEGGDFLIWCDLSEVIAPEFVAKATAELIPQMNQQGIDCLFYYGKAFLFHYHEGLHYEFSPHWSLRGCSRVVEYSQIEPDENKVRKNMRPLRRDKFEFVKHYGTYYLYPAGGNQCLLGLDKQGGNIQELFRERETRRLQFRYELIRRDIPLIVDAVIEIMKSGMDEQMKDFVRKEKILNDIYRMYVLGRADFQDDHNWADMVEVK